MIPEDFVPQLPEVFDHSFTGTYLECERMCYYTYILGRLRTIDDRYALLWGRVFHLLIERWRKNHDLTEIISIIEANIPEDVDDHYGRTQRRMQDAFIEWVKFNQEAPLEIAAEPEQHFTITCDKPCIYFPNRERGCDLTYGGRIDLIPRWNMMIGPQDTKTTTDDSQNPAHEWRLSHQQEGYVWGVSHLLGKHSWGSIIEQVICNKSKIKVHRFPIPYSEDQIREWAETERVVHAEIRKKVEEHGRDEVCWKQNKGRCAKPYTCPWRESCLSSRDMDFRYKWMRVNTKERRWDFRDI